MIKTIIPGTYENYKDLLDSMYKSRSDTFCQKLKWGTSMGFYEIDRYDLQSPTYMILTSDDNRSVQISARLLPATGPILVSDYFKKSIVGHEMFVSRPGVWEISRFCIVKSELRNSSKSLGIALNEFIYGLKLFLDHNLLEGYVATVDKFRLSLLERSGIFYNFLGSTDEYSDVVYTVLIDQGAFRAIGPNMPD